MSRNKIFLCLFLLFLPLLSMAIPFKEGVDYKTISVTPNAFAAPKGQVSVVEFFSLGCPWCFKLETPLNNWLKTKPKNIVFSRVPLGFESGWESYQRAYYVALALNKEQTLIPALFNEIHVNNEALTDQKSLANFFANQGIATTTFNQLFNSPSIELEIYQANNLMNTYKVYEIPTIIVGGKYVTSAGMAQGDDNRLIQIVKYLITKAQ